MNTISDLVNEAIAKSMKQSDTFLIKHRNFLRLIKSELQIAEVRQNKPLTNEQQSGVLKKILKANEETISMLSADDVRHTLLVEENNLLKSFLPEIATIDKIRESLEEFVEQIKSAKNDGQAIGIAMTIIKKLNIAFDGNIVKDVVNQIRNN